MLEALLSALESEDFSFGEKEMKLLCLTLAKPNGFHPKTVTYLWFTSKVTYSFIL